MVFGWLPLKSLGMTGLSQLAESANTAYQTYGYELWEASFTMVDMVAAVVGCELWVACCVATIERSRRACRDSGSR
jgi:hypothetical protein